MLNGWGQELHMFLLSTYQTTFQVTGNQEKQIKLFQGEKKKSDCTELIWISVFDST